MTADSSAPGLRQAFAAVPGEDMSLAGRRVLARQTLGLWTCGQKLLATGSAAAVHDWRVAGRRLRFALRLWSQWVGPAKNLRKALSRLDRQLAGIRDQDIFIQAAERPESQAAERLQGSRAWRPVLLADRERRLNRFRLRLQSAEYRGLVLHLLHFVLKAGTALPGQRAAAEDAGRRLLQKRVRKLLRKSKRPAAQFADEELHQLRIAFKRLRYACEFFAPYFPQAMQKYIRNWIRYQDCLGAHQDAVTVMKSAEAREHRRPAGIAPAAWEALLAILKTREKQRAKDERRKFKKMWREFPAQARGFKRRLRSGRSRRLRQEY